VCHELGAMIKNYLGGDAMEVEDLTVVNVCDALCIDISCCWNNVDLFAVVVNINNNCIKPINLG
jgi:hypothetical protein